MARALSPMAAVADWIAPDPPTADQESMGTGDAGCGR